MRTKQITEESVIPETVEAKTEDLFEMANLYPDTTGLPMTVWVSPRGNVRHDVRVKVNMTHGNQMNIDNTAVISVRPTLRVIAGQLSPADAQAVFQWISLNAGAIRVLGGSVRYGPAYPIIEAAVGSTTHHALSHRRSLA